MTRTFISFLALAAIATPVAAADSIKISLVGKTPAALHADITKAARKVCLDEHGAAPFAIYTLSACVRDSVRSAEASIGLSVPKTGSDRFAMAR